MPSDLNVLFHRHPPRATKTLTLCCLTEGQAETNTFYSSFGSSHLILLSFALGEAGWIVSDRAPRGLFVV